VIYGSTIWEPSITFTIDIKDPCRTSTITAISLNAMNVILGEISYQTFTEAVDSAGTSYGATVCGTRVYEILDRVTQATATVASVETVSAGNYRVKATSVNEAVEGTHNLQLRVTFQSYPLATDATFPKIVTDFILIIG
jgi:hypothetical protein